MAVGDAADHVRHRRREQRGLALGRGVLEDPLDVVDEAHAQHLVGLVEHDGLERVELEALAFEVVHDPARGADDDLGAARELAQLHHHALAAVDRQHVEVLQVVGVLGEGFGDLDRELARRREHQHLRAGVGEVDARQHRQCERGGLAGAGLRLAEDVVAGEQLRDAGGLDRRGRLVADVGERGQQRRRQVEVGEAQGGFGSRGFGCSGFGAGGVGHGIRAAGAAMDIRGSGAAKLRLSAKCGSTSARGEASPQRRACAAGVCGDQVVPEKQKRGARPRFG